MGADEDAVDAEDESDSDDDGDGSEAVDELLDVLLGKNVLMRANQPCFRDDEVDDMDDDDISFRYRVRILKLGRCC